MSKKLKIVADENMPAVEAMFSGVAEVHRCAGRALSDDQLADADVLLVRSVTQVNKELLSQARSLKMVGTATIGVDHIDQAYLAAKNIPFFSAPGCNADSVVDYVLTALFALLNHQAKDIREQNVGIVGVGNVGGRLAARLRAMGVNVLCNDPPKQQQGGVGFVNLEYLVQQADIICLHTPLTRKGDWPSYHLLDEQVLRNLKPGAILLNAGRGPVIDNQALLSVKRERPDLHLVLDVWEHEPEVNDQLASLVDIATPHIAGYSLEGKLRGTYMLRQQLSKLFALPDPKPLEAYLPAPAIFNIEISDQMSPYQIMRIVYDIYQDDRAMRKTLSGPDQPILFDTLRKNYPVRREFSSLQVTLVSGASDADYIRHLGFQVR